MKALIYLFILFIPILNLPRNLHQGALTSSNKTEQCKCCSIKPDSACFMLSHLDSTVNSSSLAKRLAQLPDANPLQLTSWLDDTFKAQGFSVKLMSWQRYRAKYMAFILLVIRDFKPDKNYIATQQFYITTDTSGREIDGLLIEQSIDNGRDIDEYHHVSVSSVSKTSYFSADTIKILDAYNFINLDTQNKPLQTAQPWQETFQSIYCLSSNGHFEKISGRVKL